MIIIMHYKTKCKSTFGFHFTLKQNKQRNKNIHLINKIIVYDKTARSERALRNLLRTNFTLFEQLCVTNDA